MNKLVLTGIICVSVLLLSFFIFCGVVITTLNTEASLRQQVIAQQKKNEANYDKMWKIIAQTTQITKASSDLQKELIETLVKGRGDSFIKLVHEANPESGFDRSQFSSLSNTIEAQREGFFREQSKLIDFDREHRTRFEYAFSGTVLSMFGRTKLEEPKIIASDKTSEVFSSAKDNSVELEL